MPQLLFKYLLVSFLLVLCHEVIHSQDIQPTAKFYFNDESVTDEINAQKAKLIGANFTADRFGNPKNAVHLSGHEHSYINLGTYGALKPKAGTISLWIQLAKEVYYGKGYNHNPIILTKLASRDDYYEAYAIYYDLDEKKLLTTCSNDSSTSPNVYEMGEFKFQTWYHVAITYDYDYLSFYLNGKLVGKTVKNFETTFDPKDSVMVGGTGNKKNSRYAFGTFDDILIYDQVLSEDMINELYHAPNPNSIRNVLNWALVIVSIILGIFAIYSLARYRMSIVHKKEKQRLTLANRQLETDLRIYRALMNPHFIFNALNNLHSHILNNESDMASDFLIKFSQLLRKILDSNTEDTITLEMEIDWLSAYLEIEESRFKNQINYEIEVKDLTASPVRIPIMMIQPFIENSIWHGLSNKIGEKNIKIQFSPLRENYLKCVIDDNGTGRKTTPENKNKKSLAINFIRQRLELLNKINNFSCSLTIIDKPNSSGTTIILILPILKK